MHAILLHPEVCGIVVHTVVLDAKVKGVDSVVLEAEVGRMDPVAVCHRRLIHLKCTLFFKLIFIINRQLELSVSHYDDRNSIYNFFNLRYY